MALYYTLTIRGTVLSSQFAISTHWRMSASIGTLSEAEIAESLCYAAGGDFNDKVMPILSSSVQLSKFVAVGYQEPEALFELPQSIVGGLSGDDMPSFNAFGFRQYRANANFRSSTHRVPGVLEANNAGGSFAYGGGIDGAAITEAEEWFDTINNYSIGVGKEATFTPVLVRTQYTTGSNKNPPKVTTYLDPHEISDVSAAAFYGLTSQVSRKLILGVT